MRPPLFPRGAVHFFVLRPLIVDGMHRVLDEMVEHAPRLAAVVAALRARPRLRRRVLRELGAMEDYECRGCREKFHSDEKQESARWPWWTAARLAAEGEREAEEVPAACDDHDAST